MLIVMFFAIVRLILKYIKKRNDKRMRAMGTAVASLVTSSTAPNPTVHMTSIPMLRTARGPNVRTMETAIDNTRAITGPAVTGSQGSNFEAWTQ